MWQQQSFSGNTEDKHSILLHITDDEDAAISSCVTDNFYYWQLRCKSTSCRGSVVTSEVGFLLDNTTYSLQSTRRELS